MAAVDKIQGRVPSNSQRCPAQAVSRTYLQPRPLAPERGDMAHHGLLNFLANAHLTRHSRLFDRPAFVGRFGRPICMDAGEHRARRLSSLQRASMSGAPE